LLKNIALLVDLFRCELILKDNADCLGRYLCSSLQCCLLFCS